MSGITRIAVFYHCARLGTWGSVDQEIMNALLSSGLLERADVFVRNDCKDTGLFEFPTIEMLHKFSEHNDYYVLYLHTKGVTQPKPSIDDWRSCMLFWMVEKWRDCVARLDQGYEAVGINVHELPLRHFQGNFWWTTTKYLRTRSSLRNVEFVPSVSNQSERHKAEFWLLHKETKVYTPYHHHVNPYTTCNPRRNYVGKRF